MGTETRAQSFGQFRCFLRRDAYELHCELVATKSRAMTAGNSGGKAVKCLRQRDQDSIAVQMSVTIVCLLEVVDIHQKDRKLLLSGCGLKRAVDSRERSPVTDARQGISHCKSFQLTVTAFELRLLSHRLGVHQKRAGYVADQGGRHEPGCHRYRNAQHEEAEHQVD